MKKLPKGVFRCIIDYQSPNFIVRLSYPCMPLDNRKQDRHFPAIEKLDYDNYLVSVTEIPNTFLY